MIPLFTVNMPESVDKPLLETLHSGYITQGPKVEEFEDLLRAYFRANALTVNSGTSALTLAMRLADIGPGDKVITTPMTCSATNLPILSLGAEPIFADLDHETGLISPKSVEHILKNGPRVKAIVAVDWGGTPVDSLTLAGLAKHYGVKLIIDSAHSFGAPHTINPLADFVCFSLQAIKHSTTVDGGVILCRNDKDFLRGKKLRWFGIDRDADSLDSRISEDIEEWGYKFHMSDVTATIGIEQMKHLQVTLAKHQLIAHYYDQKICKCYGKPPVGQGAYWLYTLRLPNKRARDDFKQFMHDKGIMTSQVHRRNDEYTVFKPFAVRYEPSAGMDVPAEYPGVSKFSNTMVCIPIHTALSDDDIQTIIDACNQFAEENHI
jgi:dTDP-4-amino-4,6-dideoxygalactose transaminase